MTPESPWPGLILPYKGITPRIADKAFIAPNAVIIGDVEIGARSSIWFNCVLRADGNEIRVGEGVNIQDGTVIHVDSASFGSYIGDYASVGHMALIHACTIEANALVGMSATVMDGAVLGEGAILAAGALLPPGKKVPPGELWAGTPARFVRKVSDNDRKLLDHIPPYYLDLTDDYKNAGQDLRDVLQRAAAADAAE